MIELGKNSEMPNVSGAIMFHSTESGRFMAAGRHETLEFFAAVKRGDFDGMFFAEGGQDHPGYVAPPAQEVKPVEENRCGYCNGRIFLVDGGWKHLVVHEHEATPANLSSAPPAQEVTP